ncbi:hypothetical protein [Nonomuraea rubra]|uniref:hypothetical protein n=1 Tax=Nonomuraea rubra TaxID=46180 RepID=UPI0033D195AB
MAGWSAMIDGDLRGVLHGIAAALPAFAVGLLPEGRWRTASLGAAAGLSAVHLGVFAHFQPVFSGTELIVIILRSPQDMRDDPGDETSWLVVFSGVLLLLGFFLTRVVLRRRAGEARPPLVLGAAATLLVVVDVCGVLVLLFVASQAVGDRPELTAAVQLTVIAGLVHNLALVRSSPVFVAVLFAAVACSVAAVHLPGGRPSSGR